MKMPGKTIAITLVVLTSFVPTMLVGPCTGVAAQSAKSQSGKSKKPQFKPQKREKLNLRRAGKEFKVKKGAEVAAKVRKLKDSNKSVRAALKVFEDKKRPPKIDQSFAINGALGSSKVGVNSRGNVFQRVSYEQQSSISGEYVDITFVPVLSQDMEWHGAVIADLYDSSNNLVNEYVAVSVLVMPDSNLYAWDEVYEAPVYDGVVQPPIAEPWMYTNLDVGVPLDQQQISSDVNRGVSVIPASYVQGGPARIRAWANCTFGWCGGAGISCIGSYVWSADALNSSCFSSGCGDYAIGCSWETIWQ